MLLLSIRQSFRSSRRIVVWIVVIVSFWCSVDAYNTIMMRRQATAFGRLIQRQRRNNYLPRSSAATLQLSSSCSKESEFIAMQKQVSSATTNFETESDFRNHQKKVFDGMAEYFAAGETVPAELVPVYKHLVEQILSCSSRVVDQLNDDETVVVVKILDVACGTGALWPYLAQTASEKGIRIEVTGVDLSPNMVQAAATTADTLFDEYLFSSIRHTFAVVESDILSYESIHDEAAFDLIVANACFGNFWNQTAALEHCSQLLKLGGKLAVTHPLGAAFVEKLHQEDVATVPHLLPTSLTSWNDLCLTLPLEVADLVHPEANVNGQSVPFYFCALQKVRARALPQIVRLRGNVDTGYGRGGKKLGFPTANLPSRLFQDALLGVPTGVYFGWAVLEGDSKGRNTPHKAVVNVGYSPTFEGQENPEKIVEAHLMFDKNMNPLDPPDFYGETMRLQLTGYLRPEVKFPSFAALIAQINQDVVDAKAALDQEPHVTLRSDGFLSDEKGWVGMSGGAEASWSFQGVRSALDQVQ
jgi:riboflavin kinase